MAIGEGAEFGATRRGSRMTGGNCGVTSITETIEVRGMSAANCVGIIANFAMIGTIGTSTAGTGDGAPVQARRACGLSYSPTR